MKRSVLSVDDNENDNFFLGRAFRRSGVALSLEIVNDGEAAIKHLLNLAGGSYPDLIFLDLKMPRIDGFSVLDWLQQQPSLQELPVAVFTSSQNNDDIRRAYRKRANWYLVKPVALKDLVDLALRVDKMLETNDPRHLTSSPYYRARDPDAVPGRKL